MKTNINNKISLLNKMSKNFNKVCMLLMLILISMTGVFAGELSYNQNDLLKELNENKAGNVQLFDIAGNVNEGLFGTLNQTYDFKIEYPELHNDMYIYILNPINQINETITLIWNFDMSTTGVRNTQNFTLLESGTYIFKIDNTRDGEPMSFYISAPDGYVATIYTQQKINAGLPDIMEKFGNVVIELLDINLSVWKIMFYVMIIVLVIGSIVLLVWFGIQIWKFGKEHNIWDKIMKKRSNHK